MPRSTQAFSVRIFIPTGESEGLRIIEKSNWTGEGIVFPRSLFKEAVRRPGLMRTGVYLLWGPSETSHLPRVYVGEGDAILLRLASHVKAKDFWVNAAVFTSKDETLNKAHAKHLESRLVGLASKAKRCELDNGNVPHPPSLSEADRADAEGFLDDMLLCLPIVGVNFFDRPGVNPPSEHDLLLKAKGIEARGWDSPQGFVVRKGSTVVKTETTSIPDYLVDLRRTLLEQEVLEDAGGILRLTQDYTFPSPSTAAGVVLARSANGRIEWKDRKGRTLREIQEVESSTNSPAQAKDSDCG